MSTRHAGARLRALVLTLLLAVGIAGTVAIPAPAQASTVGSKVVAEAARHRGKPYQYGAVGPDRFDCSGYTLYVFARLGRKLPHNAAQQYNVVRHIPKSSKAPGDLIFYRNSSGRITHVGIYAGNNRTWIEPRSGSVVKLQTIYSSNYVVGRP